MALTRSYVDLIFLNWSGVSCARLRCDRTSLNWRCLRNCSIRTFAPTRFSNQPFEIGLSIDGFVRSASREGICNLVPILLNLKIFCMPIMLLQIGPVKGVAVGRRRCRLIALPNHLHRQCPDYALQLKRRKIQTREEQYGGNWGVTKLGSDFSR